MASISDVFNALNDIKGKLDQLHSDETNNGGKIDVANGKIDVANGKLDTLTQTVTDVGTAVDARLVEVIDRVEVTNQLALHLTKQQQTVICILENISRNTCELVNLGDQHLRVARRTEEHSRVTAEILQTAHPDAALDLRHRDETRARIEECCPPEPDPVPCHHERCPDPGPFKERRPRAKPAATAT